MRGGFIDGNWNGREEDGEVESCCEAGDTAAEDGDAAGGGGGEEVHAVESYVGGGAVDWGKAVHGDI